jgi:hypothetical protein
MVEWRLIYSQTGFMNMNTFLSRVKQNGRASATTAIVHFVVNLQRLTDMQCRFSNPIKYSSAVSVTSVTRRVCGKIAQNVTQTI